MARQHKLNKSQAEALGRLKRTAPRKFTEVQAQGGVKALQDLGDDSAAEAIVPLRETSAREIRHVTTMARLDQATRHLVPVATPPLPAGKYRCLVIDPPWPMEKIEREVRPDQGDQLVYPVMSLDDIAALPEPSPHQRPAPRGSDA